MKRIYPKEQVRNTPQLTQPPIYSLGDFEEGSFDVDVTIFCPNALSILIPASIIIFILLVLLIRKW